MTRIDMKNLESVGRRHKEKLAGYKGLLLVCTGTGCVSGGSFNLRKTLEAEIARRNLDKEVQVITTGWPWRLQVTRLAELRA